MGVHGLSASLEQAYLFIANDLWSEILASRYPEGDRCRIWQTLPTRERIELFKRWLGSPENDNTFLLFDDIDGLPPLAIADAIPSKAKNILLTTRNPGLLAALSNERDLKFRHLGVTEMGTDDMMKFTTESLEAMITNNGMEEDMSWTDNQLQAISRAASGNPLFAARTISYIITDLMEQYEESAFDQFARMSDTAYTANIDEREALLLHKPPLQCSIMENVAVSRMRLSDPDGLTWTLMKILAFFSLEQGTVPRFLYHQRLWISELKDQLTFYDVWSAGNKLRTWMTELVQVSLASRKKALRFHPVIMQCVQYTVERLEKIQILRDIMILAYESARRLSPLFSEACSPLAPLFYAEGRHCQVLCDAWLISQEELKLPEAVLNWLKNGGEINYSQIPAILPAIITSIGDGASETTLERRITRHELLTLQNRSQHVKTDFENLHGKFSNKEANANGKKLILPLLESLKDLDDRISRLSPEECKSLDRDSFVTDVEEVYRLIISLAQDPILHNPYLGEQLTGRKAKAIKRLRCSV